MICSLALLVYSHFLELFASQHQSKPYPYLSNIANQFLRTFFSRRSATSIISEYLCVACSNFWQSLQIIFLHTSHQYLSLSSPCFGHKLSWDGFSLMGTRMSSFLLRGAWRILSHFEHRLISHFIHHCSAVASWHSRHNVWVVPKIGTIKDIHPLFFSENFSKNLFSIYAYALQIDWMFTFRSAFQWVQSDVLLNFLRLYEKSASQAVVKISVSDEIKKYGGVNLNSKKWNQKKEHFS